MKSSFCIDLQRFMLIPTKFPLSRNLAMYRGSVEDNICISDAQYYELSAQQNLWCEILEF